jgi:peptide/nickel transport system substrate-binding protein
MTTARLPSSFDEFPPTIIYFGVMTSPIPAHIFANIPVRDMIDSDAVRSNPIGWGPFKFEHIVPGESMSAVRNENYVFGAPEIERIVVRRIDPDMIADAMVAGEFDLVTFRTQDYEYHMQPSNWRYLSAPSRSYGFVAFRMGHWCFETDRNLPGPGRYVNRPGGDVLRKAMAMAPDFLTVTQQKYNGLRFPAGAYLSPIHVPFMDLTVPMFGYNPAEANRILDEAGFTTRDADGYRNWPDGQPLDIVWAHSDGPDAEFYYQFYTQAWHDIGVRVSLWEGSFHDINRIWDYMDFDWDDDVVDIWTGAWQAGANPNPSGVWGPYADWNASRHTSPEWEELLERLDKTEAWDEEYLLQAFSDIQWYKYNNVFYFPTTWTISLTALNNRVSNWDTRVGIPPAEFGWHTVRLTAAQPYRG